MRETKLFAVALPLAAALLWTGSALAGEHGGEGWFGWSSASPRGVPPVTDQTYRTECAACHMAYSPGLLPARSWEKIMTSLDDHFGDNAELAPETIATVSKYLIENAADRVDYRRSKKIARSIAANETPLRVSDTTYIKAKHSQLPASAVVANEKVRSLANCSACHTRAEEGDLSESNVRIPGVERKWFDAF